MEESFQLNSKDGTFLINSTQEEPIKVGDLMVECSTCGNLHSNYAECAQGQAP